jgi:hypothetical protein
MTNSEKITQRDLFIFQRLDSDVEASRKALLRTIRNGAKIAPGRLSVTLEALIAARKPFITARNLRPSKAS